MGSGSPRAGCSCPHGSAHHTNVHSLNAQRHLAASTRALGRVFNQLASGRRITVAADDPAGLAIANRMTAAVRSMAVARDNVLDGANMIDVAEGTLGELSDVLGRTRELLLQSANGALFADRAMIDTEIKALTDEAIRMVEVVDFNGINLFGVRGDPQIITVTLQVGRDQGDTLEVQMPEAMRIAVGLKNLDARTEQGARGGLAQVDASIDLISRGRGSLGATRNRLEVAARNLATERENTSASRSRIMDVDFAVATAERTRVQILQNASTTVLSQANVLPSLALTLLDGSVS